MRLFLLIPKSLVLWAIMSNMSEAYTHFHGRDVNWDVGGTHPDVWVKKPHPQMLGSIGNELCVIHSHSGYDTAVSCTVKFEGKIWAILLGASVHISYQGIWSSLSLQFIDHCTRWFTSDIDHLPSGDWFCSSLRLLVTSNITRTLFNVTYFLFSFWRANLPCLMCID